MKNIYQVRFPDGSKYLLGKEKTKKIKSKKGDKNDNS